ncbi:hypothetical protein AD998_21365 [bacterium 336/3]|nr:hypothetical protein AD998_21365 [bacterium 336/3]
MDGVIYFQDRKYFKKMNNFLKSTYYKSHVGKIVKKIALCSLFCNFTKLQNYWDKMPIPFCYINL